MKTIDKIKLAAFEAAHEGLLGKDTMNEIVDFCESADLNNKDDLDVAMMVVDHLESVKNVPDDSCKDALIKNINESFESGDITEEEKNSLMELL